MAQTWWLRKLMIEWIWMGWNSSLCLYGPYSPTDVCLNHWKIQQGLLNLSLGALSTTYILLSACCYIKCTNPLHLEEALSIYITQLMVLDVKPLVPLLTLGHFSMFFWGPCLCWDKHKNKHGTMPNPQNDFFEVQIKHNQFQLIHNLCFLNQCLIVLKKKIQLNKIG